MRADQLLHQTDFTRPGDAWADAPAVADAAAGEGGAVLAPAPDESAALRGSGVHTRNGDRIELRFRPLEQRNGWLRFGFDADQHEHARVEISWEAGTISFATSDWRREQPLTSIPLPEPKADGSRTLLIEKTEAGGDLVKNAHVAVLLDGESIMRLENLDLLPEMGVRVEVGGTRVLLEEFRHYGAPSGIPEYLNLAGHQVLNVDSIEANLESIKRGIRLAAENDVQLLVTPEMSLTGLFVGSPRMREPGPVAEAEAEVRRFIRETTGAPFTIVGFPIWTEVEEHELEQTSYIASRVYDPDGETVYTARKVHSAEPGKWHGYRLNEFDIEGVPVSLHICHDHRYPELQTLPVMFGCRLVLHPANGGFVEGDVSRLEGEASRATSQTHAFYMNVNANGGSYIAGPQTKGNLIAVSDECRRDNPNYPMVGELWECFMQERIRVHDAFGYWPMRGFRGSEGVALGFLELYREMGGSRLAG